MPNIKRGMMATAGVSTGAANNLFIWGNPTNGALGNNQTVVFYSSPISVGTFTTWKEVGGGRGNFSAITTGGKLYSWGKNDFGQLGDGTEINRSSPIQIGSLSTWSKLGGGKDTTHAIKTDGTLWGWGRSEGGYNGNVGDGEAIDRSSPVQIGSLTDWSDVDGGDFCTTAVKTDGTIWAWGRNNNGQVGDGTVVDRSSPVQIGSLTTWSKTSSGTRSSGAIKTDGTIWTWGSGNDGVLGQSTEIENKSSPVQVGGLTTWAQVSMGNKHMLAIKTDGTLWAWGNNTDGELGMGNVVHISSPTQVGSLNTWSYVMGQYDKTIAIKTDGTMWAWGKNGAGGYASLPLNIVVKNSSPLQVGSETDWTYPISNFGRESGVASRTA